MFYFFPSTFNDGVRFTCGQSQGKTRTEGITARKQFQSSEDPADGDTNDVTDKDIGGNPSEKQPTCAAAADAAGTEAASIDAATTADEEATKSSAKMSRNQLCLQRSKQTGTRGLTTTSSPIELDTII